MKRHSVVMNFLALILVGIVASCGTKAGGGADSQVGDNDPDTDTRSNTDTGTGTGTGTGAVALTLHTIFITAATHPGNFGSLAAGDAICVAAAAAGSKTKSLTGTWKAILSDATTNAKDRITFVAGIPIKNTNGDVVVAAGQSFFGATSSVTYSAAVKYTENGTVAVATSAPLTSPNAWTGSTYAGLTSGFPDFATCSSWTSNDFNNVGGQSGDSTSTTSKLIGSPGHAGLCSSSYSLYCINVQN